MKKKTGRNDPCPCGSGKKFKKCCERIMIAGRYKATKVEAGSSSNIQKTVGMTSLFQSKLAATPKKPVEGEPQFSLLNKVAPKQNPVKEEENPSQEKEKIC